MILPASPAEPTDVSHYLGDAIGTAIVATAAMRGTALKYTKTAQLCNSPVPMASVFRTDGFVTAITTVATGAMRRIVVNSIMMFSTMSFILDIL